MDRLISKIVSSKKVHESKRIFICNPMLDILLRDEIVHKWYYLMLTGIPASQNSGFDQKTEIRNSVCGMTIKWNWVIQFDILSGGGGEGRGICENSRLEFGKTFSNHLKYQLLSTKKNWINEMKHFHSQNWKQKDIKKKDIELLSYNLFNQTVS